MALIQGAGDPSVTEINCDLGPNLSEGDINTGPPADDGEPEERDHKLQCYSKRAVTELLEKYRELLKRELDRKVQLSSDDLLQNLQSHFDAAVQENITINGDTWETASEEQPQNDADNKSLDDLLDEHILETVLRRKHNPKKILPYIVRRLKAEREMMGLYQQVVTPQKIRSDPEQDDRMKNMLASAPGMAKQASTVMKSLQALLQKAEGLSQVMRMEPFVGLSKAHQAVFRHEEREEKSNTNCLASLLEVTPTENVAKNSPKIRCPLKRKSVETETLAMYPLRSKRQISLSGS
ncbi:kinetochore-associated protein NSL1 homolog [Polyodon spathula]|uniref:kinetochore-associated protein NSL1 homolog n=1 Tax=Polyodon spathula TaxID=7913 RepID=UPI001B7ED2DE|nr:kinetochore-associated protein NSL1 homolog [Polyodon spathula]